MLHTPSRIVIENFRLIEHADIRLNNLGLVYIGAINHDVRGANSNLSGKSTFINAFTWCTHGCDVSGNALADDVVRNGSAKVSVSVTLIGTSGEKILIKRTRGRKSPVEVHVSYAQRNFATVGSQQEIQPIINSMLGEKDLFLAAHFFGYDERSDPFALRSDKEQKSLFNILINSQDLDDACIRATEKRAQYRDRIAYLSGRMQAAKATVGALQSSIAHLEAANASERQESADKIKEVRKAYNEAKDQYEEAVTEAHEISDMLAQINTDLNREQVVGTTLIAEYHNRTEQSNKNLSGYGKEEHALLSICSNRRCPTCGSIVNSLKYKAQLSNLRTVIQNEREKVQKIDKQYDAQIEAHTKRKYALTCKQRDGQTLLVQAQQKEKDALLKVERADATLQNALQTRGTVKEDQLNRIAEFTKRMRKAQAQYLRYALLSKRATRSLNAIDFWVTGFGTKGIRVYRLDLITPKLNGFARKYSDVLFGDGSRVVYSTQKQNKDGGYAEKFDVSIVDKAGKRFTCLSSGQALRRDIIHTFSMAALAKELGKRTVDMLVLDEAFRTLDSKGIEEVIKLLLFTARRTGTILVVEHSEELRSRFPKHITVERSGGKSSVTMD